MAGNLLPLKLSKGLLVASSVLCLLGNVVRGETDDDNVKFEDSDDPVMEERKDLMCRPGKYGLTKMENRRI